MIRTVIKTVLLTALISVPGFAQNKKLLTSLKNDLAKIEKSIKITRGKIKSPDDVEFLPDLYFSLAELYVDKARLAYLLKKESNPKTPMDELDFTAERQPKLEAIETYKNIEDRFPKYPLIDKVLFFMAHEHKELGDLEAAKEVYKRITEKYPDSKYWGEAQYNLGNFFFDKKDFDFALDQYQKILKKTTGPVAALASYKIGWCYINKGAWLDAMSSFDSVFKIKIDENIDKSQLPDDLRKMDIREEALVASVWPFVELSADDIRKRPEFLNGLQYYRTHSYDKASFRRALARLGRRYIIKQKQKDAVIAFYELLRLSDDGEERKAALEDLFTAMKTANVKFYPLGLASEVSRTLRLMIENEKGTFKAGEFEKYESLLRDVATQLQQAAITSKRKEDLEAALAAYKEYFWLFPKSKYFNAMKVNLAEVNYNLGKKVDAGYQYAEVSVQKNLKPAERKDYLSSGIQSFIEAFEKSDELSILDKTQGRRGLRLVGTKFAKLYPTDKSTPTIEFNIAKSYFDERSFAKATETLRRYVYKYPQSENAQTAALLLLDCYFQQEKTDELVKEGNKLVAASKLNADTKRNITNIVSQTKLKQIRTIAGDMKSKKYVDEFLQFAKSNKGSELGETALYEAFVAAKAKNDLKVFEIGEIYLGSYEKSPKAKDVLNIMIQQSLILVEFRKAAFYLEAFAQRYSSDPSSQGYLQQAAALYEQLGDYAELARVGQKTNNLSLVGKAYYLANDWNNLDKVSAQISGVQGLFYQGYAKIRQGNRPAGISLLTRLVGGGASSVEEKVSLAHGLYLVAENNFVQFEKMGQGSALSPALIKEKAAALQELDKLLQAVINMGIGKYTVAALYLTGRANSSFASFLENSPPPAGLPVAQFRQAVKPQVDSYRASAKQVFQTCVSAISQNEILTKFARGCLSSGSAAITDAMDELPAARVTKTPFAKSWSLREKLLANPREVSLLMKLAQAHANDNDPGMSVLILQRAKEVGAAEATVAAETGMYLMAMNQYEAAAAAFKQGLSEGKSNLGLTAIYKFYDLSELAKKYAAKAKSGRTPSGYFHPLTRGL